jgi:alpha-D-xyloside xylohydrolase
MAPLDQIPLYVRAGSILPFGPDQQWTTEKPEDPIEIRVYAGADGDFSLYEDENDNYNYEKGEYAVILFHWDDARHTLIIGDRRGQFPACWITVPFKSYS